MPHGSVTLSTEGIERAARLLIEARIRHAPLERLPEGAMPVSVADGYAIQDAIERLDGRAVVGWKIGCTSALAQQLLGIAAPFPGRVFAGTLHASPARFAARAFILIGVEPEFAFTLGRDLPPRADAYGRAEVEEAAESLHLALELVEPRLAQWLKAGGPSLVADNGCNGALVHGPAIAGWRGYDLAAQPVRLAFDGQTAAEGTGAATLGHPLAALAWLANDRREHGTGLKAGQIVTTGTCAGITYMKAGSTASYVADGLGAIEFKLEA
jgi:2-keto-4-pentenoate hydratase